MFQANQTTGENCAGPSCSNEINIQQSKLIKVTFPMHPHQLSMLKRYLSSQNLPLYVRNKVSCGLRFRLDLPGLLGPRFLRILVFGRL